MAEDKINKGGNRNEAREKWRAKHAKILARPTYFDAKWAFFLILRRSLE